MSNQTSVLENDVITSEDKAKHLNRTFGEIQMAIRNIYTRICNCYPTTVGLRRQQQKAAATKGQEEEYDSKDRNKEEVTVKELIQLLVSPKGGAEGKAEAGHRQKKAD